MEYITFLEELEKRLNTLEDEITKCNMKKTNDQMMESLIHSFDEAMDKTNETAIGFTEDHLRLIDY